MEKDNTLKSLLYLLDDTDPLVSESVMSDILSIGYEAVPALKELKAKTNSELVKKRCDILCRKLWYLYIASELKTWAFLNDGYSWEFVYLISEFCDPNFDKEEAKDILNRYEELFFERLQDLKTPEENVTHLQKFIFEKLSLKFNPHPLDLSALLLNNFYDNKKGSTFLFCMLYSLLAEKRHLPIYTVAFPANLVLVYAKKENPTSKDDILFYINPVNGEIFSKKGIELFLEKHDLENKVQYFLPCSTFEIAVLYIYTLKEAYLSIGQKKKASEMNHFAEIVLETIQQRNNMQIIE